MNIFAEHAPKYWAVGLPVIPLRVKHKAPVPNGWQIFCTQLPDANTQSDWLRMYPDGNMGLPLGPQSGLVAIDIDTDDPKVIALIERIVPVSPWKRVGKKGYVVLFRSRPSDEHRTFRIKDIHGKSLVEFLAKGTQIVLPPSIHPDTMQPYVANAFLPDVVATLPYIQKDIETLLRGALSDEGIELSTRGSAKMVEWVAAGNRDSALVSICGLEARAVIRGERTLNEAFGEVETWIGNFTEKVAGDSIDPGKGRQKIVEFIKRDLVEGKRSLPTGWDDGLTPEERAAAAKEFGEDSEEWTVEMCCNYVDTQFEQHDRRSVGRSKAVQEVLGRMARSASLTNIDKEGVLMHIHGCSGKTITMTTMRRTLNEMERGDIEGVDHTEIAQALLKDLSRFGEIRMDGDRFWQWKGSHWEELPETRIMEHIAREYGSMAAAKRHSDHKGILKIAEHLVPKGLRDSQLVGINFANGYLTSDLVLHKHDPKFGCTQVLPYCYDANLSSAPQRLFSFLFQSWGEDEDYEDKVQALREAIAVTMFQQAYRFQKAFCLLGVPESGKSVLKDIILGLMPHGSVSTVPPHDWSDKFLPTQMFGKLINYCGELSEHEMISGAHFKSIIDGDEVSGQHKNRPIFQFRPICAQWFNSNHLPRTRDSSAGFTRRWLFLRFNKPVSKQDKIVGLAFDILAEERDAIAAWAVQVMPQLLARNNFTEPRSSIESVNEMAGANNSVRFFLTASEQVSLATAAGKKTRTIESELHNAYWCFCKTVAHAQPVGLKMFRTRMLEMQREFGFRIVIEQTPHGTEAAFYENLTLAGAKAR